MNFAELDNHFDLVKTQRPDWNIKDDAEYYYYRGKLEACNQINQFAGDGGTFRAFAYDYLKVEYCDCDSNGGMALSNKIYKFQEMEQALTTLRDNADKLSKDDIKSIIEGVLE